MKRNKTASVRLTDGEKEALDRLAQQQDRTSSYLIRRMILAGLSGQAKQSVSGKHEAVA